MLSWRVMLSVVSAVGVADNDAVVAGDATGSRCARARARACTCCRADGGEGPCALWSCVVVGLVCARV